MQSTINVRLLPTLVRPASVRDATVVVIDVLRASTTIVHALAAGAREVVPCQSVAEARRRARKGTVLGGERRALPIDRFDLGNSPAEYTPDRVAGKRVVLTTTNGTRAIRRCAQAARLLVGAFVNLSALCDQLAGETKIELVCAGTDGDITYEDVLLAGAIVSRIESRGRSSWANDQARLAAEAWRIAELELARGVRLAQLLGRGRGGRNLVETGQQEDIGRCAQTDRFRIVPQLDKKRGSIYLP